MTNPVAAAIAGYTATVHTSRSSFVRAAYVAVIRDKGGNVLHAETFFGDDGRRTRAQAVSYARRIVRGDHHAMPPCQYRDNRLPHRMAADGVAIV